ncbi:MAG TPA: radical SAM protein [Methanomicrobia archaeon]|nr:radical SAM protein [Methanomicrobia archaeon]HEX59205.1 radical SAM protein [Methanomicrobia archaeon]
MEFAINPSRVISALCYSIFRLEPYSICSYSCQYCYARWYRKGGAPNFDILKAFLKLAKRLDLRIPMRLATLSDPLQDAEERYKLTFKLLNLAKEHDVPIILCTKSDRIAKEPWKGLIDSMARDGLIVVQLSISSLRYNYLEPLAPPPEERLEALSSLEAPKVLRLQPLIPNYSFSSAEEFVESVKSSGIEQITTELLRIEAGELALYEKFWQRWSEYSLEGRLVKAEAPDILKELRKACDKYKLGFGLCKEGLLNLETANCCGLHLLDAELRPTLRELYKELVRVKKVELEKVGEIFRPYLFGDRLNELPGPVRKALRHHEKVMLSVLSDEKALSLVTPLMRLEGSAVVLSQTRLERSCRV